MKVNYGVDSRTCGWDEVAEIDLSESNWQERHEKVMLSSGATVGMYAASEFGESKITGIDGKKFIFCHVAK